MKTLCLNIPVIGWASATVEVAEDEDDFEAVLEDVLSGTLDISNVQLEQWQIEDMPTEASFIECDFPYETEISDS